MNFIDPASNLRSLVASDLWCGYTPEEKEAVKKAQRFLMDLADWFDEQAHPASRPPTSESGA